MCQTTSLHGSILFQTGSYITEDNRDLMLCIKKKYNCNGSINPEPPFPPVEESYTILIAENNNILLTEEDKCIEI